MAVPTFQDLFWPSLLALKGGKELTLNEIFESSAKTLNLTSDDLDSKLKTTGMGRVRYRTNWAMTYLSKAGLVSRVRRGTYQITNQGRELLKKDLGSIDANYLKENYPAFREWIELARKSDDEGEVAPGPEPGNGTPLEVI